ncbi:MAG: RpiB/LacA/LacB family sugar-phosphate isomerase [bacterium]|nr:RpiB/LacA/LacB family sugar-phosphate isomerase [bacterium]
MQIAIAADHAGYPLKAQLADWLSAHGHTVVDLGVESAATPADYPDVAARVAEAVLEGQAERAILLCGSGIGASIAANKFRGVYAAVCHDVYSAHQGVEHDRMNVLCLGARVIGPALAEELTAAFVNAQPSSEDRHARRFGKVQAIERGENGPAAGG